MPRSKSDVGGERVPLQCRSTARTRDRLLEAATQSGRSMAQELEMRLERSLSIEDAAEKTANKTLRYISDRDEILQFLLGGTETIDLLLDISFLVHGIEADQDKKWFESAELRAALYSTLEAALPELIRAPRTDKVASAFMRAVDYAKYLPDRKPKPKPEMPKGMRFMTEEEQKQFFYLNDDNLDPPENKAVKRRVRAVRVRTEDK